MLKVPEREGILRAIDGQHRLLALHADIDRFRRRTLHRSGDHLRPAARRSRRPDVRHDQREAHAAECVAPGLLSGRQLYRDESLAAAHDVVRALNDREDSPLHGEIKLLGVGTGRVAQAPLAQELKKLFATDAFGAGRKGDDVPRGGEEVLRQLPEAGRPGVRRRLERPQIQHQERASALRAFIRVAPDVVRRLDQEHADRTDFRAIGRVIAPWGRRIGDLRFETEGAWKRTGTTVDSLAKELRLALQYRKERRSRGLRRAAAAAIAQSKKGIH